MDKENFGHQDQALEDGELISVTANSFAGEVEAEILEPGEQSSSESAADAKLPESAPDEAVGLSYREGETPVISALGSEERAQAIIALAQEQGVYIHRDKALLNELKKLREGEEIPKELFGIIAAILSFSYLLQGKTPESWVRPDGTTSINTSI